MTDFFRDPDAYAVLRERVIPRLLIDPDPSQTLRVWVPGCATGEEAYSIAMALDEAIAQSGKDYGFVLFASDIDTQALETARLGVYPGSIESDLSRRRLRRYFDKTDDHYRIKRALRERVVFARQNLIEEPPYSRLDLISCRNLLIYLEGETQKRVLAIFHFALKPLGILFLGSAERLAGQIDQFEPLDDNAHMFRRIGTHHGARLDLSFAPKTGAASHGQTQADDVSTAHQDNPEQIARDLLLREFVPAAVLINRKLKILCSYGPTGDFLTLPFGAASLSLSLSLSLTDMVREEYRSHTRAITHRVFRDDTPAEATAARDEQAEYAVRISAKPLHQPESVRGLALVSFERVPRAAGYRAPGSDNEREFAEFLDKALCIKRFTPTIKALLNLIASDIGRPLADISLKFHDSELEADAERAMTELVQCDKEVRTATRWYQRRILPYRTQADTIDGVVITFTDITELKQVALESAANEQRLDLAMGAIRGGMWDMHLPAEPADARPDRVHLSARLKALLGFTDDQFPDSLQAWEERVVEADREAFADIARRRAAGAAGLDYRIGHRDGGIRWFASYAIPSQDSDEQPTRWIGIDRDITDQKLTVVHAEQARSQLHLLADALAQRVAYIDRGERFEFVNKAFNKAFAKGFDCTSAALAGRPLRQIFSDAGYAEIKPCLEAAMAGRNANCKVEQPRAGANAHRLAVNHVPHVVDGQTVGVYLLITEIENCGRRASDHVDQRRGLVHLQRLATIGEMTSSLTHDIKQPLTTITTYAGALKRMAHAGRDPSEMHAVLDKIGDQIQHANDMVSLTRDFVVERNGDDGGVDINTIVQRAVALTENLARRHGVEIHLDLHTPVPLMQSVSIQIEQVVINLMVNAMDAMDSVGRECRNLTLCTRPIDDHAVQLSVTDTGEGIPTEKLARIFDAFYTSKLEGSGLGLSLSKSIVESHGGAIWAESALDAGATFFVRLPGGATRRAAD